MREKIGIGNSTAGGGRNQDIGSKDNIRYSITINILWASALREMTGLALARGGEIVQYVRDPEMSVVSQPNLASMPDLRSDTEFRM